MNKRITGSSPSFPAPETLQQEREQLLQNRYEEARKRRQALLAKLPRHSLAVIFAAPSQVRSHDTDYPYRQDSDFYYLTGFTEQNAVLVLAPGRAQGEMVLFCQPKDKTRELWDGILTGPENARELLQVDEAHSVNEIDQIMPRLLDGRQRVYSCRGQETGFDQRLEQWLTSVRSLVRQGAVCPTEFVMLQPLVHEMRLIKSREEIRLCRPPPTFLSGPTGAQCWRLAKGCANTIWKPNCSTSS